MTRFLAPALLLAAAAPAFAHPLPNKRFDRTVDVRLAPAGVTVRYTLEMNEWSMVLDGNKLLGPEDKFKSSRDFAARNGSRIEIIEGRQLKYMLKEHLGLDVLISLPRLPPGWEQQDIS